MTQKVNISKGNSKMGAIPSVSLPPIKTCPKGAPCAKLCYAAKICRLRPNVARSYERNYELYLGNPASYWGGIRKAAAVTRYFRFHVSGDIIDDLYFFDMVLTAQMLPHTEFLAFTKQYDIINRYIDRHPEGLPANLHIIFSEWGSGWAVSNPHNLPTSAVIFKGYEPSDNWKVCPGNCFECACRGIGCWALQNGETIAFYQH